MRHAKCKVFYVNYIKSWDCVLLSKLCTQYLQPPKQFEYDTDYEDLINIMKNKSNDVTKLPNLLRLMKSVYPVVKSTPLSSELYINERELISEFFRVIFSQNWFSKIDSDWESVDIKIK